MILIWKNKGLLVIAYLMVSMFLTALVLGVLKRNFGGVFMSIDLNQSIGIGFLLSAIWTFLTRNDFYLNSSGEKVKMKTRNEFFFITMQIWSYLFLIAGFAFLFYGFF
ncbi:hypothetical protein [Cyclobacterium amurskyense]|uniref:Uncharacterized protein n=1 Tax=Cyclobacterium amurskyense TaxID=320787 RepID=A0A0H4PQX1_9BACT|nr:hypothetical protein [Cyclobacterium amurskyense]AKP50667.1 hypothetical protein CA2015_1219 [Cyclobacterium amurskyense]